MGVPSLPIRNFSKFQAMSVLLTGFQIKKWGLKHFWGQSQDEGSRLPRHQTFWVVGRGRQRLLEECEEGMFILSIHLHLSKQRWFLQKRKRYLAPQNGKKQNWRIRSTLSNMSPLNSKPLPGLTCFSRLTISSPPPFSCSASALIKLIVNQSSCGQQPSEQNNVVELILEGKGLVSINPCHEI